MKILKGLLAASLLIPALAFAAETKVAMVDIQKAIQSVEPGKKAKKELEVEFNAKKKKLDAKEKDLKEMNEDLEKKAMAMSEEVRDKKRREFNEEALKFQNLLAQSQKEIHDREQSLTAPILEKLRKVIDGIAQKDGYTLVLEKNNQGLLWARKDIDITDAVVTAFEKMK